MPSSIILRDSYPANIPFYEELLVGYCDEVLQKYKILFGVDTAKMNCLGGRVYDVSHVNDSLIK